MAIKKKSLYEAFLAALAGKVGVREVGGDNRGGDVEKFLKAAHCNPGDPWCASFMNWAAEQAASEVNQSSPLEKVPLQGYVQSYYDYFHKLGKAVSSKDAIPGDLYVLYYPSLKRYGHIGALTEKITGSEFKGIEGNTNSAGSREGNCVARKARPLTSNVVFLRWV